MKDFNAEIFSRTIGDDSCTRPPDFPPQRDSLGLLAARCLL